MTAMLSETLEILIDWYHFNLQHLRLRFQSAAPLLQLEAANQQMFV